eukprot:TRINITY_DN22086_c0_g1_i3.p1 TRINITY_DN22086_c0_g1~~TRINITY_DN22086_c0_g1_i3.p1  ORF type:complete len:139 (-),score=15.53 TRINITY_DN22086_c0_g1_i3:560-952(-)
MPPQFCKKVLIIKQISKSYIHIKMKEAREYQYQQQLQINSIFYLSSVPYVEGQDELNFFELSRGERSKQCEDSSLLYLKNSNEHQLFDDSFECYVKDSMAVVSSDSCFTVKCSGGYEYGANFVSTGCWQY